MKTVILLTTLTGFSYAHAASTPCAQLSGMGYHDVKSSFQGYRSELDPDNDGIACESNGDDNITSDQITSLPSLEEIAKSYTGQTTNVHVGKGQKPRAPLHPISTATSPVQVRQSNNQTAGEETHKASTIISNTTTPPRVSTPTATHNDPLLNNWTEAKQFPQLGWSAEGTPEQFSLKKDHQNITFNQNQAKIAGKSVTLKTPAKIQNATLLIPLEVWPLLGCHIDNQTPATVDLTCGNTKDQINLH